MFKNSNISWKKVGLTCGLATVVAGGSFVALGGLDDSPQNPEITALPTVSPRPEPTYVAPEEPHNLFDYAEITQQEGLEFVEDDSNNDIEFSFVSEMRNPLTDLPQNSITMKIDKTAHFYVTPQSDPQGQLSSATIALGKLDNTKIDDKPATEYPQENIDAAFKDALEGVFSKNGVDSGKFVGKNTDKGVWVLSEREGGYILNLVVFNESDVAIIRMDLSDKEFPEILKTFSFKTS